MDEFRELYQQLILDHNQNPRNFRDMPDANHSCEGHNPLCGDEITVYLKVENDVIQDISFTGSGCAISKASASIMTTMLKGQTVTEARNIFNQFHRLVTTGETSDSPIGKLAVLAGVHKFPSRVKCAVLGWHTAMESLKKESGKSVSTE